MQISFFQRMELLFWDTFINLSAGSSKLRKMIHRLYRLWHDLRNRQAIAIIIAVATFGYALGIALAQVFPR